MAKPEAGDEVTYTGAGGVRLVGERWKPGAGHPPAGIALLLHGGSTALRTRSKGSAAAFGRSRSAIECGLRRRGQRHR
jgi:hypothetical protein